MELESMEFTFHLFQKDYMYSGAWDDHEVFVDWVSVYERFIADSLAETSAEEWDIWQDKCI